MGKIEFECSCGVVIGAAQPDLDDRSASGQLPSVRGSTLALTGASLVAFLFLALGLAVTGELMRRLAGEPSAVER